jgi:hypothetical protein
MCLRNKCCRTTAFGALVRCDSHQTMDQNPEDSWFDSRQRLYRSLFPPKRPDRLKGPPSFPSNGFRTRCAVGEEPSFSSAKVQHEWNRNSVSQYAFMACIGTTLPQVCRAINTSLIGNISWLQVGTHSRT